MLRAFRPRRGARPAEHGGVLAEEDGDSIESGAGPHELARRAQLVELLGPVVGHAARQYLALPQRHRQRQCLQRNQRLAQRRTPVDPVPTREEPPERRLLGRLDLAPQRRERGAPQTAEHVRVAPLALDAAGTELAADERVLALELAKQGLDVDAEP